ncbi:SRPBCC family protein [Acidovorax sp.]|uniref:SRPBCC family protein n=1 Tax=Acidovorax sp. TaxID=1872122 RepID=UPI00391B38D0
MLKTIALVLLAALGLLLAYAATRPDTFRVERSRVITAPPERVFGLIHDLRQFNTWNPYERKDPALRGEYSATTAGPGARYAWHSDKVGTGSMEIVDAEAPRRVGMKLDFVAPFEAHNRAEFTLQPEGDNATRVTWALHGPVPYLAKIAHLFFNMDRMVGQDFEDGLEHLQAVVQKPVGS